MYKNNMEVSVVIPFYENLKWLNDAVSSVLNQTHQNFEIIIIDDGSSCNLASIGKLDNRIKIIRKKNGGPASARNVGIMRAKGDYIAFLDSDDLWIDDKLEKQLDFMLKNNFIWSHHSYEMFKSDPEKPFKTIRPDNCEGNILNNTYLSFKGQTSSFMIKRKFLQDKKILFPEDKRYGQDIVFFREISRLEKLGYLDITLSKFRIRGNNAGFRPEVQIQFRYQSGRELLNQPEVKRILPKSAIIGYKINEILFNSMNKFKMVKYLYVLPYIMFKIGSRSYEKKKR